MKRRTTLAVRLLSPLAALSAVAFLFAVPAAAQDDDLYGEEDDALYAEEGGEDAGELDKGAEADRPPPAPEEVVEGSDLVRAKERDPRAGTPLIAKKKFPMAFRLEITGAYDQSYGERFVKQLGGHLAVGFHIFDWLQVEAFGGYMGLCSPTSQGFPFHPSGCELGITKAVRIDGRSVDEFGAQPALSDLWQVNGFGGFTVQWAPIYGKLSAVSEYDLNFQLYGFGGLGIDGIWKVEKPADQTFASEIVLPPNGIPVVPSAHFGAGLRFIPWKYVAIRAELRNYMRPNPPVDDPEYSAIFDLGWTSTFSIGVSFLL